MVLNCLIEDCQIKLGAYVIKLFIDRVFKFDLFQCMPLQKAFDGYRKMEGQSVHSGDYMIKSLVLRWVILLNLN